MCRTLPRSNVKPNLLTCYLQREENCLFSSCCFIYFLRCMCLFICPTIYFPLCRFWLLLCLNTVIFLNIVQFCLKQKVVRSGKWALDVHLDKINNYCLSFNKEKWKRKCAIRFIISSLLQKIFLRTQLSKRL